MTEMRYPLYGKYLDRAGVSGTVYGGGAGEWHQRLRRQGVDVLIVGGKPSRKLHAPPEVNVQPWISEPGAPFEMIQDFGQGVEGVAVYRLLPAPEPEAEAESSEGG